MLLDQVEMILISQLIKLISQLIKGISRVLQKLFKYFNDTIISTFFVPPTALLSVRFCLSLNEALLSAAEKSSDSASINQSWFISIVLA